MAPITDDERNRIIREHNAMLARMREQRLNRARERPAGDTEARRERAIRGFQENGQTRRAMREEFLQMREDGLIPGDAMFGGIHRRKCGNRDCDRQGGWGGVRFLKIGNKRMYRCEACYRAVTGDLPPPAPEFAAGMMTYQA
jgi:hypothetical protein